MLFCRGFLYKYYWEGFRLICLVFRPCAPKAEPESIVEVDINLVLANDGLLGNGVDDVALLFVWEPRPAVIDVLCSQEDFFFGKLADLHHVKLGLSVRDLVIKLAESVGPRVVLYTESVFVYHPGLVEIVEFLDLSVELLAFGFEDFEKFGLRKESGC